MASKTGIGRMAVVVVDVAGSTIVGDGSMGTIQYVELVVFCGKRGWAPPASMDGMAGTAFGIQAELDMIWLSGLLKFLLMTMDAIGVAAVNTQGVVGRVALVACNDTMHPNQWKPDGLVYLGYLIHLPVYGCMATGTVGTDRLLMDVGMAGVTIGFGLCKEQSGVAIAAIYLLVLPFQRKLRLTGMVELRQVGGNTVGVGGLVSFLSLPLFRSDSPAFRRVAVGTIQFEGGSVRRLTEQLQSEEQEPCYWWQSSHLKRLNLYCIIVLSAITTGLWQASQATLACLPSRLNAVLL